MSTWSVSRDCQGWSLNLQLHPILGPKMGRCDHVPECARIWQLLTGSEILRLRQRNNTPSVKKRRREREVDTVPWSCDLLYPLQAHSYPKQGGTLLWSQSHVIPEPPESHCGVSLQWRIDFRGDQMGQMAFTESPERWRCPYTSFQSLFFL